MDIKAMLGGNDHCSCNRVHTCDIRFVEIGRGVLEKLTEICADFGRIVLVADENTYPLCGDRVSELLGGTYRGTADVFTVEMKKGETRLFRLD